MANAIEIRRRLLNWLEGRTSLQQFEDWLVLSTWDVHRENDPEAEHLVDDIEMNLSEYSGGQQSIQQLRLALHELARDTRPFVSPVASTAILLWKVPRDSVVSVRTALAAGVLPSRSNLLVSEFHIAASSANTSVPDIPSKSPASANSSAPLEAWAAVA